MPIEKCFFCDKIIIPLNILSLDDIENFFKKNNIEFTLNHERSRTKIGNKIICLRCEDDLRKIINFGKQHELCEECKQQEERDEERWKIK